VDRDTDPVARDLGSGWVVPADQVAEELERAAAPACLGARGAAFPACGNREAGPALVVVPGQAQAAKAVKVELAAEAELVVVAREQVQAAKVVKAELVVVAREQASAAKVVEAELALVVAGGQAPAAKVVEAEPAAEAE